jgi:ATP-dependent RNA helicase UAP56/SUB2
MLGSFETEPTQPTQPRQPTQANWIDLFLRKELLFALQDMSFHQPSEVQARGIPKLLQGHNLICQARAGMGKTAVFVLAILSQLTIEGGDYAPHQCIVVAHTRELAYQIQKEFVKFSRYMIEPRVRANFFVGGMSIGEDMGLLSDPKTTPHIIIGTPGRLIDLLQRGFLNMAKVPLLYILDPFLRAR